MKNPGRPLRNVEQLISAGLVKSRDRAALALVADRYPVAVTPEIAGLIDSADPNDPIARQFVPDAAELSPLPGELADPIGDAAHSPVEGVVHRYPDRVLLKLLHVCPVYCRFCFRRESVGRSSQPMLSAAAVTRALDYIRADANIWEVIFTGGDPFMLAARRIGEILAALGDMQHVKVVRFHTRVPVVDSQRINAALVAALKRFPRAVYVALHANHPRELTGAARQACARLIDAGIPMVSQSVLLKGVNDNVETLEALMRGFLEARIKPYYLHHADMAPGTAHFRTGIEEGRALVRGLLGRVSGLAQPTYVLDIPGGHGKSPIGPQYLHGEGQQRVVEDFRGLRHEYPSIPKPSILKP